MQGTLRLGTTTGSRIGTAPDQKLAFYNSTPITQPANDVPLDLVLSNLGLRASGGTPAVSTSFKIGSGVADTDYTLTFDGENSDGVITWLEDEGQFQFSDRIKTNGGVIGKITTPTDNYNVLVSDETIVASLSAFTVTLPSASASLIGQIFTINTIRNGTTLDGAGSDTIDGALTQTINQYGGIKVQCISANTWITI
jgi:hypothetical protein